MNNSAISQTKKRTPMMLYFIRSIEFISISNKSPHKSYKITYPSREKKTMVRYEDGSIELNDPKFNLRFYTDSPKVYGSLGTTTVIKNTENSLIVSRRYESSDYNGFVSDSELRSLLGINNDNIDKSSVVKIKGRYEWKPFILNGHLFNFYIETTTRSTTEHKINMEICDKNNKIIELIKFNVYE